MIIERQYSNSAEDHQRAINALAKFVLRKLKQEQKNNPGISGIYVYEKKPAELRANALLEINASTAAVAASQEE
ncbi:hypothetical protein DCCM_3430 [Desulfocucumis palustris]|uniref:Uncharacterized protein n=1 Tax=Desulfocucumis palustris TaxID=1898651 RepID=A0A2L2XDL0_9FIRM|nr:hypothetical protein [Desulfocucumis palustris]GBF34318.1 hypothetical protein DCCM_3430 [Desulfocucumis palustris]